MKQNTKFRWHYVYYLLAAFDIVTITASLLLSHQITDIFNNSVAINTTWASRASSLTNLSQLVTRANAPGNDVFENHDIEGERTRFEITLKEFQNSFLKARSEIEENVSVRKHIFLDKLDSSYGAVEQLADEARAVFISIKNGNAQEAGGHMATMDRHYAIASSMLGELSNLVLDRQKDFFNDQLKTAAFYRQFELVFAAIIGLIIIFVTFYGHVIARKFRDLDKVRENSISELEFVRFSLDEHAIVSVADIKGNITFVNERFCDVSGYSQKELIGSNHNIVKSDEQSDAFWVDMWKTIANGNVWNGEIKNINKNGDYYWVQTTIVPRRNDQGKPYEYIGIRTEITQNKNNEAVLEDRQDELERHVSELADSQTRIEAAAAKQIALSEDLAVSRDAAEAANMSKSQFLAAMSHEIRTPMAGVIGMADLILDSDLSPQQLDWATSIKSSGANLLEILNEILDQSKLEAGKLDLSPIDFHLAGLVEDTAQLFGPKVEEKHLSLDLDIGGTLPEGIHADSLRIGQVLSNFLSNALKFTEAGRITVRVEQEARKGGELLLKFSVTDSGIGLSKEAQSKLFTAFTQADSSTSRKYGGTGLGLSISKQLAELMGGEIGVESSEGIGSTFWFTVLCQPAKDKVEAPDKCRSADRWQASRSLKVLVAEDNEVNQQLIRTIFKNMNHEVAIADNGMIAIDIFKEDDFDLILMDIRMPIMDGLQATTIIRTDLKSDIPICPSSYKMEQMAA